MGDFFIKMKDTIKREKEGDWAKAVHFIPKLNEIIIYDCEDGSTKFKVGDGVTLVSDLAFVDSPASFIVEGGLFNVREE